MNLHKFTRESPPTEKDLEEIGVHLQTRLEDFLGQEIVCFWEHLVIGEALVRNFRNQSPMLGPFNLQWDGVLLYDVTDSSPSIDAEIFLFSHGERLGTLKERGSSYILLSFDTDKEPGNWRFNRWSDDEFGEWRYILKPRTEDYREFKRTYG